MTFAEKQLSVRLKLASGVFEGGGNSATVDGLRVACQITATMGPSFATMEMAIYGLPLSLMQQLTTVGPQWNARYHNEVDVWAGENDQLSLAFSGSIFNCWVDGAQMPDVCLRILASPYLYDGVAPAAPTSIQGSADVAGLIKNLASQMGTGFENNGVSVKLSNPYLYGSSWDQIRDIADQAGIDIVVDRGVIVVSPRGSPRQGEAPLISPSTGLVGYPTFSQNNVLVRSLFKPEVKLLGPVNVQSSLQPACGTWQVIKIDYDLESQTPGGNWFQTMTCLPLHTQ